MSRGLARRVDEYKALLAAADQPRRGDLDGRGTLSQSALEDFCRFFLEVSVDQVQFMEGLLGPGALFSRIDTFFENPQSRGDLHPAGRAIVREILQTGAMERNRAPTVTGLRERQSRTVMQGLPMARRRSVVPLP